MKSSLINRFPSGINAKGIYDLILNSEMKNWVFTTYLQSYSQSILQAKDIYKSLTKAVENDNISNSKKTNLKYSNNTKVLVSTIDKELLLDYIFLKNFQNNIETIQAHGKTSDLQELKSLSTITVNIIDNVEYLDQRDFIKNYEKNVRNSQLIHKLSNGSKFCCSFNENELMTTISAFNILKTFDKSTRVNIVNFIKDIKNLPKHYQNLKFKILTNILLSIQITGSCSKAHYYDILCIIVDCIDDSVIRKQYEDEDNKVYTTYRYRKINSIFNHH